MPLTRPSGVCQESSPVISQSKILLVTLAIAVVLGALSLYVLENAEGAYAMAAVVLVLGFFVNACAAKDQDQINGIRFSVAHLFEFSLAFALVIWGFPIVMSLGWIGEWAPDPIVFVLFYVQKLLLTFYVLAKNDGQAEGHKKLTFFVYLMLTFASVIICLLIWPFDRGTSFVFQFFVWWVNWFPVPTLTFYLDLHAQEKPSLRFAVWRSVIEIFFLCPMFCYFAIISLMIILKATGLWPTGF